MQQLDLKYKWKFFITMELLSLIVIAIFSLIAYINLEKLFLIPIWFWVIVVVAVLVVTVFCWVWTQWTHHFYRYEIKPDSLRKESGVIWKKYTTIPYGRVQNIDIERGLWDRILGLSCIVIQTAGSSTPYIREGEIPGLSVQTAEQLREELIQRVVKSKEGL